MTAWISGWRGQWFLLGVLAGGLFSGERLDGMRYSSGIAMLSNEQRNEQISVASGCPCKKEKKGFGGWWLAADWEAKGEG